MHHRTVLTAIFLTIALLAGSMSATAAPGGGGGGGSDTPYDPCPPKSRYAPPYKDTDGDRLSDCVEVNIYGTDPRDTLTDSDWLEDGSEVLTFGTDPLNPNTDGDAFGSDSQEVNVYFTDPLVPDSDADGDGLSDGAEATFGLNPANPDTDGDGLPELDDRYCLGINGGYKTYYRAGSADYDGDGLGDPYEDQVSKTDACEADTDEDGFSDPEEINAGTDPLDAQSFP